MNMNCHSIREFSSQVDARERVRVHRRPWRAWIAAGVAAALLAGHAAGVALGPPVGSEAPAIKLTDLNGKSVDTSTLAPKSQVIIFGDITHEGVRTAAAEAVEVLAEPRHAGDPVVSVLVIAHNDAPDKLREEAAKGQLPAVILHDPDRKAFGAYRVLVMPTVVVVDPHGKVAYSMSGPVQHFKEKLSAALMLCAGKISNDQFQRIVSPEATPMAPEAARADRLIHLGNELVRHGLYELAESRFQEAVTAAPDNMEAKLGLAGVMVRTGRLDEAEAVYRAIAAADKASTDAAIGIATVQALRGGEDLAKAELAASEMVAKYPSLPKARYLMGLIYERKGNCPGALAEFKKAAELLIPN